VFACDGGLPYPISFVYERELDAEFVATQARLQLPGIAAIDVVRSEDASQPIHYGAATAEVVSHAAAMELFRRLRWVI
jgi:hypothetical protein